MRPLPGPGRARRDQDRSGYGSGDGYAGGHPGGPAGEPGPDGARDPSAGDGDAESDAERRRRRALFLRELNEAKALRDRVQPRRARAARMRQQMRMRTFRW
ncbi:hypothetical protein [Streptomyces sp. CAU 1734]|uniref:hypothetical protein n=1 Tax=Streptomyces sp. CAU 1734 TaxID=3140360 RepID=UPI00325FEDC5